jgi:formylglycine-generating enzyme required for sulfatase activity
MNLFLDSGRENQHFQEEDFPLAAGLTKSGTLVVGTAAESDPVIWILSHQGRCSIQPELSRMQVLYNGMALDNPAWLEGGDEIALGNLIICVTAKQGDITLTPRDTIVTDQDEAEDPSEPEDSEQQERFGKKLGAAPGKSTEKISLSTTAKFILPIFALLALGVAFVLIASPVYLRVSPRPDSISISGFPPPVPISDRYLALPGNYMVEIHAKGYKDLKKRVSVALGTSPTFDFKLQILPGILGLTTPPIEGATILVDGQKKGLSPLENLQVDAGARMIRVISRRYLPEVRKLEIHGMGKLQTLEIKLKPGWGKLSANSIPDKAMVKINGKAIGETPLKYEPLQGSYELEFLKEGWKPVKRKINIQAGISTTTGTIQLEKIDGTLNLKSTPAGATITVDGKFQGQTPSSFPLVSDRDYQLKLSKRGYTKISRTVRVVGGKTTPLTVLLRPELGTIFVTTTPPGARLILNGRPAGSASQRLELQTVPQSIEISKPGYVPYKTTFIPRRGISKKIEITLETVGAALRKKARKGLKTPGGQKLSLIYIQSPARFIVGASRREPGRRSNEVQYPVVLTRSFWISEKEVTNTEFKKFKPRHNSGNYRGTSLDKPDQPVVNVPWEDAARYTNWLSKKEGLQPAYKSENGKMVSVMPLTNGYRLPTEAEWEFVSRYDGGKKPLNKPLRFPWGNKMPPPNNSGNYADDGAQRLPFAIPGYVDGFPVSAPVGKFSPNKSLINDLGGNVAEWCHDYYDVPLGNTNKTLRDPSGPRGGRFHVIKGASWRSGSITELRLSYRDYAEKPRNDIGFRVVRHVAKTKK